MKKSRSLKKLAFFFCFFFFVFLTIELVYLQGKQENHTASVKVKPPTRSPSKALQRPRTRALLRPEPPGATAVRPCPPSSLARLQGSCSPIFTEAAVEIDSPSQPRPVPASVTITGDQRASRGWRDPQPSFKAQTCPRTQCDRSRSQV